MHYIAEFTLPPVGPASYDALREAVATHFDAHPDTVILHERVMVTVLFETQREAWAAGQCSNPK